MSALIDTIGPLAFWLIAVGVVPALLLVSVMVLIGRITDRVVTSRSESIPSR